MNSRYMKDHKEGLHQFLESKIDGYGRQDIVKYLDGFAAFMGKPNKSDSVNLASAHFSKWYEFLKAKGFLKSRRNKNRSIIAKKERKKELTNNEI